MSLLLKMNRYGEILYEMSDDRQKKPLFELYPTITCNIMVPRVCWKTVDESDNERFSILVVGTSENCDAIQKGLKSVATPALKRGFQVHLAENIEDIPYGLTFCVDFIILLLSTKRDVCQIPINISNVDKQFISQSRVLFVRFYEPKSLFYEFDDDIIQELVKKYSADLLVGSIAPEYVQDICQRMLQYMCFKIGGRSRYPVML